MDNQQPTVTADAEKTKLKATIKTELKRLALINFTLADVVELYNQLVGTYSASYDTCNLCSKLSRDVSDVTITVIDTGHYDDTRNYSCCPNCFRYCNHCHLHYLLHTAEDKCHNCHKYCYTCKKSYFLKKPNTKCPECKHKDKK